MITKKDLSNNTVVNRTFSCLSMAYCGSADPITSWGLGQNTPGAHSHLLHCTPGAISSFNDVTAIRNATVALKTKTSSFVDCCQHGSNQQRHNHRTRRGQYTWKRRSRASFGREWLPPARLLDSSIFPFRGLVSSKSVAGNS